MQVVSSDQARSEALRQRLSDEGSLRMPAGGMEDGSSSFAALFGGGAANVPQSAFASTMARRDSTSSMVSSRLDDLGLGLDLPGLQVGAGSSPQQAVVSPLVCVAVGHQSNLWLPDPRA